jgi:polysaccharide transporter, PST family
MMDSTENLAAIPAADNSAAAVSSPPAPQHGIRVLQNTAVVFVGRIVGLGMAAAASFILARYLGPERMGEYGAIYAYLTLVAWLPSFGLNSIVLREAAQNRDRAGSIIYTGMYLSAGAAGLTAVISILLAPLFHLGGQLYPLVAIASVEILLLVPVSIPAVILVVDLKQWFTSGFNVIRQALMLLIVLTIYWMGAPLLYVILGRLAVAGVEVALNWHVSHRYLQRPREFEGPTARMLLREGFPMAMCVLATSIYSRIDQVMLHMMSSDQVLGQYSVAVRISEFFEALPAAFLYSLAPVLSVAATDAPRFRRLLGIGYRYLTLAGAGICVIFCVGAGPIIRTAYGRQYAPSAHLLAILIWAEIAIFFGNMLANGLIAAKVQRYLVWMTVVGAAVNVGLNLYVIPRWNAVGASWATAISAWAGWVLVLVPVRETRHILVVGFRALLPVTALALAVSGGAFLLPVNEWLRTALAGVAFGGLALSFGFVRRDDFAVLGPRWQRFTNWASRFGAGS